MLYRALLAALTAALVHTAAATEVTPNVVLVYVDDMRLDLMGNAGHPYLQTPNLDRIASEGVKYTNAYVASPLCGPSRGTLMTGLLPTEHDIRNHSNVWTSQLSGAAFLPGLIKDAGASNAIIGKWHSGNPSTFLPEYDHYFLNRNSVDPDNPYFAREYNDNGTFFTLTDYNTDVMFDELSDYINEQGSTNNPYFVYTSVFSPHGPFAAAPRHAGTYAGNGVPAVPSQDFAKLPSHLSDIHERYATQAEMILAIDEGLGRMFTALEQAGTLDDTVIIFSSDNGYLFGEHGLYDKALPYQESVKVPLLVRWGSNIPANQVSETLVSQADIAVTIADLMGAQLPQGLYGQSLANQWRAGTVDASRQDVVSIQYPISGADPQIPMWATVVTADGWKLVAVPEPDVLDVDSFGWKYVGLESMLFDLNADPYEMNSLAGGLETAHIEAALTQRLIQRLVENAGDTAWVPVRFLAGDTDGDLDIDDTDLGTLFGNYTGPGGGTALGFYDGDTDGDGDVDDLDLGTAFVNHTGPLAPASVPEPGGLVAMLVGLSACGLRRRNRR
ncbi:MAG: sulfatase-like hydrolase/transferase [Phycisphaeraceae bacterium]